MTATDTQTRLFYAAETGDSHAIRLLAMGGADLEARNEEGFTPFAVATRHNHADTAMTILAAIEMQYVRGFDDPSLDGTHIASDDALKKSA